MRALYLTQKEIYVRPTQPLNLLIIYRKELYEFVISL
jgi:hypothetical protein